MEHKLNKYKNKIAKLQNIFYYFNTYGEPIPEKYSNLLNIMKFNFPHIIKATNKEYKNMQKQAIRLCNDDHGAKSKLIIGSFNIVFTLFIPNQSIMNIIITNKNTCYIETYCGFSNNKLLNLLKRICLIYNLDKIETFSIYQPESKMLFDNYFVLNKNKYLEYELS